MSELDTTDWSKITDGVTEDQPRYAMDSKLHVQFYLRPVLMTRESEDAGRPIFQDVVHVRILVPGDKLSIIDRVASDDDKGRFAAHYDKFKAGRGTEVIGTRLEAVPFMTRSKVEEYKFFGIHTVEQLAGASDEVGQKFPGFQGDKQKCQKFLEATTGTDARVAALEKMVADLKAVAEAKEEALSVLTSKPGIPKQQGVVKQ